MAVKTKSELLEEIEAKNQEILDLENEVKKLKYYQLYEESANQMAACRDAFVNAGFSESEAFELLKLLIPQHR